MKLKLSGTECMECTKAIELCVCSFIQKQSNRHQVIFFQHPQEPDHYIGTAKLASLALKNSKLKVGLSTSNLKKLTDDPLTQPSEWGVLYLGSGFKGSTPMTKKPFLFVVKPDGTLQDRELQSEIKSKLKGIILLDGTWSQAKTLWWRNAWLLKCQRLVLSPKSTSLYGKLRKEPRKECLSTIETVADTLEALGEDENQSLHLKFLFAELLKKYSDVLANQPKEPTL